jgi:hypothetical protein
MQLGKRFGRVVREIVGGKEGEIIFGFLNPECS